MKLKMINYIIKNIIIFLSILLLLSACSNEPKTEVDSIKETIEGFYDAQYDAYLVLEYKDITPYLDMTKIQNRNKLKALKTLVMRRKYIDEKEYGYVEKRRFPLTFVYKNIEIRNGEAKVTLEIKIDEKQAYPPFIDSGVNEFALQKQEDKWKIKSHTYESIRIFEISTDKELPEIDVEVLKKQIDNEFNGKK